MLLVPGQSQFHLQPRFHNTKTFKIVSMDVCLTQAPIAPVLKNEWWGTAIPKAACLEATLSRAFATHLTLLKGHVTAVTRYHGCDLMILNDAEALV